MAISGQGRTILLIVISAVMTITFGCEEGGSGLPVFKREYSILHHIDVNTYKEIDCSAENVCHVEWYKDGVPFPFGWNVRQQEDMGVSIGYNNQTLILRKAAMQTKGNYTCIVSNQNGNIERHLQLKVQGNDWIHAPILAFDNNCDDKTTSIGYNATFTCRFFIGPKADETVVFWYYAEDTTKGDSKNAVWIYERELNHSVYDTPVSEFDGKFLSVSLHILNVTEPVLGTYFVYANNGVGLSTRHSVTLSLSHTGERRGKYWNLLRGQPRNRLSY